MPLLIINMCDNSFLYLVHVYGSWECPNYCHRKYIRLWYHVRIYDYSRYIPLYELSRKSPHYATCWCVFLVWASLAFPYGEWYAVDKLSTHVVKKVYVGHSYSITSLTQMCKWSFIPD